MPVQWIFAFTGPEREREGSEEKTERVGIVWAYGREGLADVCEVKSLKVQVYYYTASFLPISVL